MMTLPADRSTFDNIKHGFPSDFDSEKYNLYSCIIYIAVLAVLAVLAVPPRKILCKLGQEVARLKHIHVFFEILVVWGGE